MSSAKIFKLRKLELLTFMEEHNFFYSYSKGHEATFFGQKSFLDKTRCRSWTACLNVAFGSKLSLEL